MSLGINNTIGAFNSHSTPYSQYYLTKGTEVKSIGRMPAQLCAPSTNAVFAELGVSEINNVQQVNNTKAVDNIHEIEKIDKLSNVLSIYKEPVQVFSRDYFFAYNGINFKTRKV